MLTCAEMKALEERAFADGVSAEALMEEAGAQIAAAVRQFFPRPGRCLAYFGKGHNGGDALVAARHLAIAGWNIALPVTFPEAAWSELTAKKYRELQRVNFSGESHDPESLIVLDGLLGISAGGALRTDQAAGARDQCVARGRMRASSRSIFRRARRRHRAADADAWSPITR